MAEMMNSTKLSQTKKPRRMSIVGLVGSLLGALIIWIYAIGYDSTLFERTFSGVEVVIEGTEKLAESKGFTLAQEQKFSSITVVAKGKRSDLNELDSSDFRAFIDVSLAEGAGNQTLNITVDSPNGIEVVEQSSTTAVVFVDEFTQRNDLLTVSVDTGNGYVMSPGITFVDSVANPLSVTVAGPKSVLDSIEGAYVNFNLDGYVITDHISGYGAIELRDKNGNVIVNPYISISENTAYVDITVTKQKTIPVRLSLVGGMFDANELSTNVSASSIVVSGRPEALDSISEIVLEVDERGIDGTQTFDFSVGSMLPAGVNNESGISKISVTVTMPELSVRNYRIEKDAISVINLPDGNIYEILNGIAVTLIGPRDSFADFDPAQISATLDFDRVTVELDGSYTANAKIELGGMHSGIYVQSKNYAVNFKISPDPTYNKPDSSEDVSDISDISDVSDTEN